jgi:synaptic vesicle membrane protein VAT-1
MKSIYIARFGGPEALELRDEPDPVAGPGEALIRVRAAGLNFADVMMRMGLYSGAPPTPFVPGYEIAGEIEKLGAGVRGLREGDRVYTAVGFGGYSEKVATLAERLLPIPKGRSFEEAAALPVNYLTAYHALYVLGNLRPRADVLVHAAAGGVGLAALQLAKLREARVFGTASKAKHPFLLSRGADAAIDYRSEDFEERVKTLTDGRGVQLALDPIGGESFRKSYRCLAPSGLLVAYGLASASSGERRNPLRAAWAFLSSGIFTPLKLMMENKGVVGFHMGKMPPDLLAFELADLHRLWSEGRIQPHIGKSFKAAEVADAHRFLQGRESVGKVVLTF